MSTVRTMLCCAGPAVLVYEVGTQQKKKKNEKKKKKRKNEKKKTRKKNEKKNVKKAKESKEIQKGSPTNTILVGKCRLRRAESWENTRSEGVLRSRRAPTKSMYTWHVSTSILPIHTPTVLACQGRGVLPYSVPLSGN